MITRLRRALFALAVSLVASACVGSASGSTDIAPSSTTSATPQTQATTSTQVPSATQVPSTTQTQTSTSPVDLDGTETPSAKQDYFVTEYDLQRFLAAAEFAIAGSAYEGAIYESPEIYIATAQGFCARLSQGDEIGQIAQDYLAAANIAKADDEDLQFVGALLGAGVQTLCPEHGSKL